MKKFKYFFKNFLQNKAPFVYFCIKKSIWVSRKVFLFERIFKKDFNFIHSLSDILAKFNSLSKDYISDFFDVNKLNTNKLDDQIESIVLKFYKKNKIRFNKNDKTDKQKIGVLFTEIYANGGHTPLIERFVDSFYNDYSLKLFSTRVDEVRGGDYAKKKTDLFSKVDLDGVNWDFHVNNFTTLIVELYNKIVQFAPRVLFCYIHPNDIVIASTLALLKKNLNIKIININMQDHSHNFGFKFVDLIIDARPAGQDITKNIKGYKNTMLMPLQQKKSNETIYFTEEEKLSLREKIGIKNGEYFTLTGSSYHKIFEKNGSKYINMIKDLLIIEPKLKHVIMTELPSRNKKIIEEIFKDHQSLLNRLIIIDRVSNFDIYMQACDLFIDSFLQGGALAHLDMMRNKRPTVLKINEKDPILSFEYYLPKNYEYKYCEIEEMKNGILKLLYSKEEQQKSVDILYKYYLDNYEFEKVKIKYKKLIDGSDDLTQFFDKNFYEN